MWKLREPKESTVGETTRCNKISSTGLRTGSYEEIGKEYLSTALVF